MQDRRREIFFLQAIIHAYQFVYQAHLLYFSFQQWLCHLRGPVLEVGRPPVVHQGPTLARSGIRLASQPEIETHG